MTATTERPAAPERPPRISESELAAASTLTQPGALMGTPGYMSPEQLRGKPTSVATDQFEQSACRRCEAPPT